MQEKVINKIKFKRVYIEITNVCNLSCSFCPKTGRRLKFMQKNEFEEIIKKIKPYTDYIYFHIMGEPLLNKNLRDFLEIARQNDLKVNITTNGTLIKENKDVLLNAKALRQINVSLHSFEANSNVNFEEYINTILDFALEASSKTEIITSLRLWNQDGENTIGENALNGKIIEMIQAKFKGSLEVINQNRNTIINHVSLNNAEKFEWPDMNREVISDTGFCQGLRNQIGILVDGTVVPCCLDSEGNIKLGNIFNQDFEAIVNGERARSIYNGFSARKRVEELCKRCGYSERFKKA